MTWSRGMISSSYINGTTDFKSMSDIKEYVCQIYEGYIYIWFFLAQKIHTADQWSASDLSFGS